MTADLWPLIPQKHHAPASSTRNAKKSDELGHLASEARLRRFQNTKALRKSQMPDNGLAWWLTKTGFFASRVQTAFDPHSRMEKREGIDRWFCHAANRSHVDSPRASLLSTDRDPLLCESEDAYFATRMCIGALDVLNRGFAVARQSDPPVPPFPALQPLSGSPGYFIVYVKEHWG